jgi:hypothetical protein
MFNVGHEGVQMTDQAAVPHFERQVCERQVYERQVYERQVPMP